MVKIKAQLSITRSMGQDPDHEVMNISLYDKDAHVEFFDGTIPIADLMRALTAQVGLVIDAEVRGLERVGKKREQKPLSFVIPTDVNYMKKKEYAKEHAQSFADLGWTASTYFDSQSSFSGGFRGEVEMAHTTQYRWVDKGDESDPPD